MEVHLPLCSFQNVRTDNSAHSRAVVSEEAYGNAGYKHVRRRRAFNVHVRSEPENSTKERNVFDKRQNVKSELEEYDSDKCDNKGSGLTKYKPSKRYPCKFCNKWLRGNYIALHMMKHMGTLAHVCNICAKQFAFNSNLKVHQQRMHDLR
jgi:hypothetical protein